MAFVSWIMGVMTRLDGWMVGWLLVGLLVCLYRKTVWLVNYAYCCLVSYLFVWLVGWLISRLVDYLVGWMVG